MRWRIEGIQQCGLVLCTFFVCLFQRVMYCCMRYAPYRFGCVLYHAQAPSCLRRMIGISRISTWCRVMCLSRLRYFLFQSNIAAFLPSRGLSNQIVGIRCSSLYLMRRLLFVGNLAIFVCGAGGHAAGPQRCTVLGGVPR